MDKPSEIVVLVEDRNQQRLIFRFLKHLGFVGRVLRPVLAPAGRGSGEQWVREKYAEEVKALRKRHAKTWLVVAVDADTNDVVIRANQLAQQLETHRFPARTEDEAICHLIPKRNIETWILCLTGDLVDEATDYSRNATVEERIPAAATTLFDWSRLRATIPPHCVASLHVALPELRRLE